MKSVTKWVVILCLVLSVPALADDLIFAGTTSGPLNSATLSTNGTFTLYAPINAFQWNQDGGGSTNSAVTDGEFFFQGTSPTAQSGGLLYQNSAFDVYSNFVDKNNTGTTLVSGTSNVAFLKLTQDPNNGLIFASVLVGAIPAGSATFAGSVGGVDLTQFNFSPTWPGVIVNVSLEGVTQGGLAGGALETAVVFTPEPSTMLLMAFGSLPLGLMRRRFYR